MSKIVKDKIMSGSPRIADTRIRVRDVVEKFFVVKEPTLIAQEFKISVADVHEALSYYYQHPDEIREEIKRDREFVETFSSFPKFTRLADF